MEQRCFTQYILQHCHIYQLYAGISATKTTRCSQQSSQSWQQCYHQTSKFSQGTSNFQSKTGSPHRQPLTCSLHPMLLLQLTWPWNTSPIRFLATTTCRLDHPSRQPSQAQLHAKQCCQHVELSHMTPLLSSDFSNRLTTGSYVKVSHAANTAWYAAVF